jgi:hypothetical protein
LILSLKGLFVSTITTAKTYSQALDLISSSTQATVFRINEDGSLRKQTFREKVADFFAGRIVGKFQTRKDSKDAQVAQALIGLYRNALNSDNTIDRAMAAETPLEEVHVFSRFFEARARIESRQVRTSEPNVRRDSIASLRHSTQTVPVVTEPIPEPVIPTPPQSEATAPPATGDDEFFDAVQDLSEKSTTESRADLESSSQAEEDEFFDALDDLGKTDEPKAATVEPDAKALKAQRRFLERRVFRDIRNEIRAAQYIVGFSDALRAGQNMVLEHPAGKKILTQSIKDDIESIVSEAQVEINKAIMNHLQMHADEDLDQAMNQIIESVVNHLSDFTEEKIKDYSWVLRKTVDLIINKDARRDSFEKFFQETYKELSIQSTNYPPDLDDVITSRVDAMLAAQVA